MNGDLIFNLLFWAGAGFFGGLFLFVMGLRWFIRKRMIENTPTSKVRSIAMGLVEVYGKILPAEKQILKSPLTGSDCVYYKYTIEEYRGNEKGAVLSTVMRGENPAAFYPSGKGWALIKKDADMVNFFLADDTGKVLVDPKGAGIEVAKDYEFSSGFGKDPPPQVMRFLENIGISHDGFFGMNKQMRFSEYYIAPGDKLYIMGTAGDNPFVEEARAKDHVEDIMIQKGQNEKFYYISDKPEKEILSKLRWKSMAGVFGGAALTLGCMAVIFIFTGLL